MRVKIAFGMPKPNDTIIVKYNLKIFAHSKVYNSNMVEFYQYNTVWNTMEIYSRIAWDIWNFAHKF